MHQSVLGVVDTGTCLAEGICCRGDLEVCLHSFLSDIEILGWPLVSNSSLTNAEPVTTV